jgi:DNA-binding MarR family transcriptional regulator
MIKELLQQLGLNPSEIKVYTATLEKQKATPAQIAHTTKINRPTVYSITKKLVAKNLLIEDLGSKTLYVSPAPPSELKQLIAKEEDEFRSKAKIIEDLSNELLLAKAETTYPVPKIRFIEEAGLEKHLYARASTWTGSVMENDGYWWGFQDYSFLEAYHTWIDWYWKQAPEETRLRLLSNQSELEKRVGPKYERREIKLWNESENFTATTWVAGDYLIMIVTSQKPFYLVEIHDKTMAHNFRETFKSLWGLV